MITIMTLPMLNAEDNNDDDDDSLTFLEDLDILFSFLDSS